MFLLFTLKFVLSPILMVLAWHVGNIKGAKWGGRMAAFPLVGGPILLALGTEHGVDFAHSSAKYAILGVIPLSLFSVIYSWSMKWGARFPRRNRILCSLIFGWSCFLVIGSLLQTTLNHLYPDKARPPSLGLCLGLALGVLIITPRLLTQLPEDSEPSRPKDKKQDLGGRVLGALLLVGGTTGLAWLLGSEWSGILASFPVALSVVAGFTILNQGPAIAHAVIQGYLHGLFGYLSFLGLFAWTMPRLGLWLAFCCALPAAPLIQLLHHRYLEKHAQPPTGSTVLQKAD